MRIQAFLAGNSPKNICQNKQNGHKTAQSFTANFEYKSMSKIRHFFAKIIGEKLLCATEDGFVRVAKINRKGQKVLETKSYPNSRRYAITKFETKGGVTRPCERTVYDVVEAGEKPVIVSQKCYVNGYEFYRLDYGRDDSYTMVQELEGGKALRETGLVDSNGEPKNIESIEVPSKNPQKQKLQRPRYNDGAIIKVKAKDFHAFVKGFEAQTAQNTNKSIKKIIKSFSKNTNNVGKIFVENPFYAKYRDKALVHPNAKWSAENLKQWGFDYPYPKGENPEDVFNVYITRGYATDNFFELPKFLRAVYRKIAKQTVRDFYSSIESHRSGLDNLFNSFVPPQNDLDFQKSAEYLYNSSLDAQYTDYVKEMSQYLSLKPVEYKPKFKKSKVKAE